MLHPTTLPEHVPPFLHHLALKNYSPQTARAYKENLRPFTRWCGEQGLNEPAELTSTRLRGYELAVFDARTKRGQPLAARTRGLRISAVKAFCLYLVLIDALDDDPAARLELPRKHYRSQGGRGKPQALSVAQLELVLAQPNIEALVGHRDRAVLELLFSTGIRRAELCALDLTDFDFERGTLRVAEGKGGKMRVLPVGARALAWVHSYVNVVRARLLYCRSSPALFVSSVPARLSPAWLSSLTSNYVEAAGFSGSCHLFRHSMATAMLEGGAELRYVQAMLGHERLSTTELYTHVTPGALSGVHRAAHPHGC